MYSSLLKRKKHRVVELNKENCVNDGLKMTASQRTSEIKSWYILKEKIYPHCLLRCYHVLPTLVHIVSNCNYECYLLFGCRTRLVLCMSHLGKQMHINTPPTNAGT